MLRLIAKRLLRWLWPVLFLFPIDKSKIVVVSFHGRGFSDHAKYVIASLLVARPDLNVYWAISDPRYAQGLPASVHTVKYRSMAYAYHLATAGLWIDNSRKGAYARKRSRQLYMQLWHAGNACLKKVEKHAEEKLPKHYVVDAKIDAKQIDVMVSGSTFTDDCFRDGFWYPDGEIIPAGSPRNDIFFHGKTQAITNKVRETLGLPEERIVLYAPTFRAGNSLETYFLDFDRIVESFESQFGGRWKVVLRLHPNVAKESLKLGLEQSDCVVDATYYDDMQELLVSADALITDYSSSVFDYILTKRPVFIHATDYEVYLKERGLYFDLRNLPFRFSETSDELAENIERINLETYQEGCARFMREQGFYDDGRASEKVVEWISSRL